MTLTRRQHAVLSEIQRYIHVHGIAPTLQELSDRLGVSRVSVWEHLTRLEAKGYIRRGTGARSSVVLKAVDVSRTRLPVWGTIGKAGVEWR